MSEDQIFTRWCTAGATTKGVRLVRVIASQIRWVPWKDADRWAHYQERDLFDDKAAAIADGERRRTERRATLQRQIDKLNKPMRVVEKIKEK